MQWNTFVLTKDCHFTLAVGDSKHTPIIRVLSPLRTPSDHSEILTPREESSQNKCGPKRIKLTCSNVKHLTPNTANGPPEFNENPAWHKTQLLFHAPGCTSSSWHMVQEEWGKPGVEVDRTRAKPQHHLWSRYKPAWLRSKGGKWKGTEQGQLAPSGGGKSSTHWTRLGTVWFWCHGNLQKELHNGTTFLEGLYELKYCYATTRFPKIASLSTRKAAQMPTWSNLNFHPKIVSKLAPLSEAQTAI